jgi:hypothetical protein
VLQNELSGRIPTDIGRISPHSGSYFLLGDNDWSGTIPSEIGKWNSLSQLAIYDAPSLTGTIPSELGKMTTAHSIWIYGTSVYGTLPAELDNMNMYSFRIQNNLLSGNLPNLTDLFGVFRSSKQEFWFQQNYFTGVLPTFGQNVVPDCEQTHMTPIAICRNPKICSNGVTERPTLLDVSNLCRTPSNSLIGDLTFTPASEEDCFSGEFIDRFVRS